MNEAWKRKCKVCGVKFIATIAMNIYCSRHCKYRARYLRRKLKMVVYGKKYRSEHVEYFKEYGKKWRQDHPGYDYEYQKKKKSVIIATIF